MGIEPTSSAWKAEVLPLNYTRQSLTGTSACQHTLSLQPLVSRRQLFTIQKWWWGLDSNQRTQRERIYSPSPLTTRPPLHLKQSKAFSKIISAKSTLFFNLTGKNNNLFSFAVKLKCWAKNITKIVRLFVSSNANFDMHLEQKAEQN